MASAAVEDGMEALYEKAPETFLRALDVCHALKLKGFEPAAIEVRKQSGEKGSYAVIQAAVDRYRSLSGYIGPESFLPVTLANDLVNAADAVFKRYQRREEQRLETLSTQYGASVEELATHLQRCTQEMETLQAQLAAMTQARDQAQALLEQRDEEGIALRAKLQLSQDAIQEHKARLSQLEQRNEQLHEEARVTQAQHHDELKTQLTTVNKQWEIEVSAWKLRYDNERRALETTREKALQDSNVLRQQLQQAHEGQLKDQRRQAELESRVSHLENELAMSQREITGREAMMTQALEQSNAGLQRVQEEAQGLRVLNADRDMLFRKIAAQLGVAQPPQKILAAVRALMQG